MSHYDDERENSEQLNAQMKLKMKVYQQSQENNPVASSIHDAIHSPKHYAVFADMSMESIDVIEATLTYEEFKGFLKGNILKYRLRAGGKDAIEQDIGKAKKYNEMLGAFVSNPKSTKEHCTCCTA